jgi:lipopolysaccharide transport system permease protein
MIGILIAYGIAPGPEVVLLPVWLLALLTLALGVGVATGGLVVHYRDVAAAVGTAVQLLLYLTPVAYSATAAPERFRAVYDLNPIAALLEGVRWSLLSTEPPSPLRVACSFAFCVVTLVGGCIVFTRLERGLADVI